MTNGDLKRLYEQNHISEMNEDFVRYDSKGNIKVGDTPSDKDAINKDTAKKIVSEINSVKIRNTKKNPVINATDSTVQTVATKYIQDNYSREPEELDGLFITFTDHDNDVVEYDYFNGFWQDTGRNGVDLSDYASLTEENTFTAKQNFNVETEFNGVAEHNADINVNDSTLNVVNTTNDTVTKYGATKITVNDNEISFPSEAGTLALTSQIDSGIPLIVGTDENPFKFYDLENDKYYYVQGKFKTQDAYGNTKLLNIEDKTLIKWTYDYNGGWASLFKNGYSLVVYDCRAQFYLEPYDAVDFSLSPCAGALSKIYFSGTGTAGDIIYRASTIYGGQNDFLGETPYRYYKDIRWFYVFPERIWVSDAKALKYYLSPNYESGVYFLIYSGYIRVQSDKYWEIPNLYLHTYTQNSKKVIEFFDVKFKETYDESNYECPLEYCLGSSVRYIMDDSGYITLATADDGIGAIGTASITSINGKTAGDGYDFWANANSFYAPTTSGTAGQVLQSNGEGVAPTWTDMTSGGSSSGLDANKNYYTAGAIATSSDKYSIVSGEGAESNGTGNIVVGTKAEGPGDVTNSDGTTSYAQSVIIGNYASANTQAVSSVVAGTNGRAEAEGAIQLGTGTNTVKNSLQVQTDNIYKVDTHTLTVDNAQVNGNDVYGVIKGEGAPTTATAGKIGQVYQDTTNDKRYFCTYSADTYGWQEIQNKMTQSLTSLADGSEVIVSGDVLMQRKTYVGVTGTVTFTFGITFDTAFLPIVTNATFVNLTNSAITVNVGDTAQNIVIGAIGIKKS